MTAPELGSMKSYVRAVDLSGIARSMVEQAADSEASEVFDRSKVQAQVVGSGLFSFAQGVDPGVREAISNSALLAQLVANKRASAGQSPIEWFAVYADVLQNVGWVLQDSGWSDYTARGNAGEVDQKIIEVMTVALGAAPTAVAIIAATISALHSMDPESSWLKIFSRESQKAKIARFQIGLVEKSAGDDIFVSLLGCLVEAETAITQVLFFKFKNAKATFKANGAKVSINRDSLTGLGSEILDKVRAYQHDYLSSIQDI